jgi:hypothetical protein
MVGVGDEPQRERQAGEHQGPRVQVGDRAPAGEADAGHAVMEVLAVGGIYGALVLQALEHHEGSVEERDREQDQGQDEGHDHRRLDRRLDGNHPHQQTEQIGAAIAHEAGRGREVVDQEAERRPRGDRCQYARFCAVEVERDDRERTGDDHAHPGREPVHAVGEIDYVHHHDEPHHRKRRPRVRGARVGEVQGAHERQSDGLDGNTEVYDHQGRHDLAGQLHDRRQVEAVVECTDAGDQHGGEQDPVPQLGAGSVARGQERKYRNEHPDEDRQATEQGRGTV